MISMIKFTVFIFLPGCILFTSCKKVPDQVITPSSNRPPVADAGLDKIVTLPKDSIVLDGSNSFDRDGIIISYKWIKISGPVSPYILQADSAKTSVKNLLMGVYQFELTVMDNGGLSAKDTVQFILNDPSINKPPIANAGPDQTITLPTSVVTLNGSNSTDPDNNIISYIWTKISGPSFYTITDAGAVQTEVKNLVQGVYQFELKVTDAGGLISKDTIQVVVISLLLPPVNHKIKVRIVEYGTGLPLEGVKVDVVSVNLVTLQVMLITTTDVNGECWFDGTQVALRAFTKTGYWNYSTLNSPFPEVLAAPIEFYPVNYAGNGAFDYGVGRAYTCDSLVIKLFPKSYITVHIKDSSMLPLLDPIYDHQYFSSNGLFNLSGINYIIRGGRADYQDGYGYPIELHPKIDTTFQLPIFGNTYNLFNIGNYDDDGNSYNFLHKEVTYISKNSNKILNITY